MVNRKGFINRHAKVLKTVLSVVLVLCLVLPMLPSGVFPVSAAITYLTGLGTSDYPYEISSAAELQFMAAEIAKNNKLQYRPDRYYQLKADIDLTGYTWTPIGTTDSPFTGTFIGGGYTVSGLSYSKTALEDGDTTLANYGFFGVVSSAEISGLHVIGTVENTVQYQIGGLIAYAKSGLTLTDCSFTGTVHSGSNDKYTANCGGLIGQIGSGTVSLENCTFEGEVIATASGEESKYNPENVGGLVGMISGGATVGITKSQAILTELSGSSGTGGLVGTVCAPISTVGVTIVNVSECYTEGKLISKDQVGGLIGRARDDNQNETVYDDNGDPVLDSEGNETTKTVANNNDQEVEITIYDSYSVMDMTDATGSKQGGLLGGARSPSAPEDVTISISHSHFAGQNAKYPIVYNDSSLCTVVEPPYVYYREDSVQGTTTDDMITVGEERTVKQFKDGTVTTLLNGEGDPRWADDSDLGYPVMLRQKKPSLSTLTLNGEVLDVTNLVHNVTVENGTSVATVEATSGDSAISINGNGEGTDVSTSVDLTAGRTTTITVLVTLNGFKKTYTLSIYRKAAEWNGSTVKPTTQGSDGAYQITTAEELAYLLESGAQSGSFVLTADIDLGNKDWEPTDTFTGTFDGGNYAIKNLKSSVGLFHSLSGTVKDLTVYGTISGGENVGGVAGTAMEGARFENCDFHGDVAGTTNVGGLVGAVTGAATVTKCGSADGTVTGTTNVGGLVGSSVGTLACDNSYSAMTVVGREDAENVGGLLGDGKSGDSFTSCHFAGTAGAIVPSGFDRTTVYVVGSDYTAAEFADGTVASVLGNEVWATSAAGYPVPSNIAAKVSNAFIANDIANELINDPTSKKYETAYSTSIRANVSSQGIRFKFPLTKEMEDVQSVVVLIAKQGSSGDAIKDVLKEEHLYAHSIAKGADGYYQYLQASAYTKGSSHNVALVDKTDYYQFAASLVNFANELTAYEAQYIARAYATFTDAKGQQIVVYSDPIGDKHYYNSVLEVAECHYDPHNAATLELNELVYIKQVYETKYQEVMPEDVLPAGTNSASAFNPQEGGADAKADAMRNDILTCDTDVDVEEIEKAGGTVYYISPNGDDANNGTSRDTAWKSVDAVNLHADDIDADDAVLFERGGIYRSVISLKDEPLGTDKSIPSTAYVISAETGVTYGAYGDGDKPLIYASYKNYAWGDCWEEVKDESIPDGVRIWKVNTPYSDAGSVVFNHGEKVGIKRFSYVNDDGTKPEYDLDGDGDTEACAYPITKDNYVDHLENDYEYFHDHRNGVLYLRLDAGCPSDLYEDIEICSRNGVIYVPKGSSDVTIDNLAIKYAGHYGIAIKSQTENVTVQNCELGWLGGCQWQFLQRVDEETQITYCNTEGSRIGNAVEFWETTTNALVQNNWIYQVFDAGLSPQGTSTSGISTYKNIVMRKNLVEYCTYNIEFFDRNGVDVEADNPSVWDNYLIEENILRFAGYGWGSQRKDSNYAPSNICGWTFTYTNPLNIIISGNIFDCSAKNTVYWGLPGTTEHNLRISGNTFYEKASSENKAIYFYNGSSVPKDERQRYATGQNELEEAIKCFDSAPKLVKWLYDDHFIFDVGDLD